MGKRGPKSTPTITLRNRGSWRGSARKDEPVLPVSAPEPPDFQSPEARAEWDRVCPLLMGAGVLTEADRAVLVLYCEAWAEYVEVEQSCRKDGRLLPILTTPNGCPIQNPAYGLRNTLRNQVKQLAGCLGLTPADRANIKTAPKKEAEDTKKRFFKGGA